MKRSALALGAATTALALASASPAAANHHACPQITTIPHADGTTTINVARKNCAPTYVPYPIGGPKSPLISGANQTVPIYLPGVQTPLLPDLGQWGDIVTPPYSDPLNDAGPDLSCAKPNLGQPQGGDPPIPSPGSANDPFPIEYVLRNGKVQLDQSAPGGARVGDPGTVCPATVVRSDGKRIWLFFDANIKTLGSAFEVLTQLQLPLNLGLEALEHQHEH